MKSSFKKRTITGLFLVLFLAPAAYFGGIYFLIAGLLIEIHAAYEMMNMFSKKYEEIGGLKYVVPIMCAILGFIIYLSCTRGLDATTFGIVLGKGGITAFEGEISVTEVRGKLLFYFLALAVMILFMLICFAIALFKKQSGAQVMMSCITTFVYCGLILGFGACIEYIQPLADISWLPNVRFGGRSFAYLVIIVMANDVVAYLFGSKFGKTKLCPNISPNKTVEGAIAGIVVSALIGTLFAVIPHKFVLFDVWNASTTLRKVAGTVLVFIFSMVIAICGIFGDLIASKFKRTYEIKDFGTILPGHGGILDRFDSLIFASAFYYCFIQLIQLFMVGLAI